MREVLDRIALALEAQVRLTKAAQADYRERDERHRKDFLRAEKRAAEDAIATRRLMVEQSERNEKMLQAHEVELARLAARDIEQTALLREAGVRSAESLDTFKVVTGLGAPDYIPEHMNVSVPDDGDEDNAA